MKVTGKWYKLQGIPFTRGQEIFQTGSIEARNGFSYMVYSPEVKSSSLRKNSINFFHFWLQFRIRLGANSRHFPQESAALGAVIIEGLSSGRSFRSV